MTTKTYDLSSGWFADHETSGEGGGEVMTFRNPGTGQSIELNDPEVKLLRQIFTSADEEGRPTKITLEMLGG